MQINKPYSVSNLWDVSELAGNGGRYKKIGEQTTASGDSVDISDEAKKLFSEMIHKYDQGKSGVELQGNTEENSGGGAPAQDIGGSSTSGDSVESVKKQIQSLKSQLSSLTAQMTGGAGDAAVMGKINALEAQIAALEAQLNAMQQA